METSALLLQAFAVSLICLTLFQASRPGMVLYPLAMIVEVVFDFLPSWLYKFHKPFFGCMMCMCSFWGTVYFFTLFPVREIKEYVQLILFAGAFNFLLEIIVVLIQSIILIYKHESFHWADRTD